MMRGRGLRTIKALPAQVVRPRIALMGSRFEAPKRPPRRRLEGPAWHVPGYEQLAFLEPQRG
jgi:hypothetical protein